jgi:hypothetical protein
MLPNITQKIFEIKTQAKQSISMCRRFCTNPSVDLSYFYEINKVSDHIDGIYHEYLDKYPNNITLAINYSYFIQ